MESDSIGINESLLVNAPNNTHNNQAPTSWTRAPLFILLFGQLLAILNSGTGVFSSLLTKRDISIPFLQTFPTYVLLFLYVIPLLIIRKSSPWPRFNAIWFYALVASLDVMGNYLIVTAYRHTSLVAVHLIMTANIPFVLLLSRLVLSTKFTKGRIVACGVALLGVGLCVLGDYLQSSSSNDDDDENGSNKSFLRNMIGDAFVLGACFCYSLCNVVQEWLLTPSPSVSHPDGVDASLDSLQCSHSQTAMGMEEDIPMSADQPPSIGDRQTHTQMGVVSVIPSSTLQSTLQDQAPLLSRSVSSSQPSGSPSSPSDSSPSRSCQTRQDTSHPQTDLSGVNTHTPPPPTADITDTTDAEQHDIAMPIDPPQPTGDGNVKNDEEFHQRCEYLAWVGLFGTLFCGALSAATEHHLIHEHITKGIPPSAIGYFIGFAVCLFLMYSGIPVLITRSGAIALNLSLLTTEIYSVNAALWIFSDRVSPLYYVAFLIIAFAIVLYHYERQIIEWVLQRSCREPRET